MTKKNDYRLLGDVSRLLHTKPHKIVYLLTSGQVPEPEMRLGNRRLFSEEDIERLAAKLSKNKERTKK
jgi:DNA-binding transcriptional MerR regulator